MDRYPEFKDAQNARMLPDGIPQIRLPRVCVRGEDSQGSVSLTDPCQYRWVDEKNDMVFHLTHICIAPKDHPRKHLCICGARKDR